MRQLRWGARRRCASISSGACILGLVACGGQTEAEPSPSTTQGDLAVDEGDAPSLNSGANCAALLASLQNQLLEQVSARAEQAKISADVYYGGGVFIDDVVPSFSGALPAAPGAAPLSVAPSGGFSQTTAQVPGVDEADFVKGEGDRLYLLSSATLFVLDTEPANATQIIGSIPIEGDGAELFVRDGQVVVFSRIYGPIAGTEDTYSPYIYYYPSFTKLTVIDTTGEAPEVLREAYVEGDYGYGRRQDSVVRGVVLSSTKAQLDYPSVSYVDIFGNPRSQEEIDVQVDLWALLATESIEDSTIENYLPSSFERVDGELVARALNCADFYVPGAGNGQSGSTSVLSLDLDAIGAPLESVSVLGYSDGVYVDGESLILRQTSYGDQTQAIVTPQTNIHRFELDGTSASYSASGSVSGYVQGQFGLDQADGVIRVAVAEDLYQTVGEGAFEYLGSASHVVTLGEADGQLVEVGRTPNFGLNESLTATRFVGDRGYVAAYSNAPTRLYVVDLSDPAAPSVVGSLDTLDFYTNQLFPLPGDQLLGFGQSIDALGYSTVSLRLFDVADASAPSVAHEFVFDEQVYSDAAYDPRAITLDAAQETLAFPVQDGLTGLNSLEVFRLSSDAGFTPLGSVTPPAVELSLEECLVYLGYGNDPAFVEQVEADPAFRDSLLAQCRAYNQAYVRRGLFRGDDLFAISSLNVAAYSLDALDAPLSVVDLPQSYYYPVPIPIDVAPAPAPEE